VFCCRAQVLLNWGNFLYERSQLAARAGQVCPFRSACVRIPLNWLEVWRLPSAASRHQLAI